jgi:hypothetical protein
MNRVKARELAGDGGMEALRESSCAVRLHQ